MGMCALDVIQHWIQFKHLHLHITCSDFASTSFHDKDGTAYFYECNLIDGSSATEPIFNVLFTMRRLYILSWHSNIQNEMYDFYNFDTLSNE